MKQVACDQKHFHMLTFTDFEYSFKTGPYLLFPLFLSGASNVRVCPQMYVCDVYEKGKENIYKIILDGMRDPEISYNVDTLDPYGNVIEITDQTRPAYQFDKLKEANKGNILGAFVAELEQYPENSMEHQVLCEGVRALMETRRG